MRIDISETNMDKKQSVVFLFPFSAYRLAYGNARHHTLQFWHRINEYH